MRQRGEVPGEQRPYDHDASATRPALGLLTRGHPDDGPPWRAAGDQVRDRHQTPTTPYPDHCHRADRADRAGRHRAGRAISTIATAKAEPKSNSTICIAEAHCHRGHAFQDCVALRTTKRKKQKRTRHPQILRKSSDAVIGEPHFRSACVLPGIIPSDFDPFNMYAPGLRPESLPAWLRTQGGRR
jgi:hypothetical protein